MFNVILKLGNLFLINPSIMLGFSFNIMSLLTFICIKFNLEINISICVCFVPRLYYFLAILIVSQAYILKFLVLGIREDMSLFSVRKGRFTRPKQK